MPEPQLPASADAISPLSYIPKMDPKVPAVTVDQCPIEDEALGQCMLSALPHHHTHRVDWDGGFQARWSTQPAPVLYPV